MERETDPIHSIEDGQLEVNYQAWECLSSKKKCQFEIELPGGKIIGYRIVAILIVGDP